MTKTDALRPRPAESSVENRPLPKDINFLTVGPQPKLLILCPFPMGVAAGQRLKYEQYLNDWKEAGWDITVSPFMDHAFWQIVYMPRETFPKIVGTLKGIVRRWRDIATVRNYDLVYVFMNVMPVGTAMPERLVGALAKRLIYDIEDNILGGQPVESVNPVMRWLRAPNKARTLLKAADTIITASPFMVERYRKISHSGECIMIPPSIDTDRFVPGARDPASVPVIGWTGTFSSQPYLDILRPVLQRLAQRVRFKLRVISNFDYALPDVDLEVIRWTKEKEVEDMQAIDIGLYPLPRDDWVLGKAGLKVIQYMAFGIPSVSSDVGTATLQVRHGETGYLAETEEDWLSTLEMLVRDAGLRARIGAAAREEAVRRYSRQAVAGQYRAVLDRVHAR